jgi:hypothetical protein
MIHIFQTFEMAESHHKVHRSILDCQVGLAPLQSQTFPLQEEICFHSSLLSNQICEVVVEVDEEQESSHCQVPHVSEQVPMV